MNRISEILREGNLVSVSVVVILDLYIAEMLGAREDRRSRRAEDCRTRAKFRAREEVDDVLIR